MFDPSVPRAHRLLATPAALAAAALLGACSGSSVTNETELPEPEATASEPSPESSPATPAPAPAPAADQGPGDLANRRGVEPDASERSAKRADGESCSGADDCTSGLCEGEGCAPGGGTCVAKDRRCTMDLRQYCGCDGKSFQSSGSCPNRRFTKREACEGDPIGPRIPLPKP